MTARVCLMGWAALLLAACVDTQGATSDGPGEGFIRELPESVLQVVDRSQDLTAVRVDPADGCLVYRYRGPVETTYLPLRTVDGRPICTRVEGAAATG